MNSPDLPADGGCRCGAVRFRVTTEPVMTLACHCNGCRRMTASAFSLTTTVPEGGFAVVAGEPAPGALRTPAAQHWHCPECHSSTHSSFTSSTGFVNVRATAFDATGWFSPFCETMAAEKLAWASLPVRHSFPGWPPVDSYPALMAEYAAS